MNQNKNVNKINKNINTQISINEKDSSLVLDSLVLDRVYGTEWWLEEKGDERAIIRETIPFKEWRVSYWEEHNRVPEDDELFWETGTPLSWSQWLKMKRERRKHWA